MTILKGRRLPDTRFGDLPDGDLQPGDYWKYPDLDLGDKYPSNLTRTAWGFYSPDGNGLGTLLSHTVREFSDGTISVRPGDGSSNSILHKGGAENKVWHGYIHRGVWTPA